MEMFQTGSVLKRKTLQRTSLGQKIKTGIQAEDNTRATSMLNL